MTDLEKLNLLLVLIEDFADEMDLNIQINAFSFPFGNRIIINNPNYVEGEHRNDDEIEHSPELAN